MKFENPFQSLRPAVMLAGVLLMTAPTALSDGNERQPLRIALPPLDQRVEPTAPSIFHSALGLHLRERLAEVPGMVRVSDARLDALHRSLTGPAMQVDEGAFPEAFRQLQPVEVVLAFSLGEDDQLVLIVDAPSGRTERRIAFTARDDFRERVWKAVREIGRILEWDEAVMRILLEDRFGGFPKDWETFYAAQSFSGGAAVRRQREVADVRLERLFQRWQANHDNPHFAREVLRNALQQAQSNAGPHIRLNRQVDWAWMAGEFFQTVLGSPYEEAFYPLLQQQPALFERELYELCRPFTSAGGDILEDASLFGIDDAPFSSSLDEDPQARLLDVMPPVMESKGLAVTAETRLGALRSLGFLHQPKALEILVESAGHFDARVRAAAAFAFRFVDDEKGLAHLRSLSADSDPEVAWAARYGLWLMGETHPAILDQARELVRSRSGHEVQALRVLAVLGTEEDLPVLRPWEERSLSDALRREWLGARARLGGTIGEDWIAWLRDPDTEVVRLGLSQLGGALDRPAIAREVSRLANDPYGPVARQARSVMRPLRPAETSVEQAVYDLTYEEPYLRFRTVIWLSEQEDPLALEALEGATSNRDPHVRAEALKQMAVVAPERARPLVRTALQDPHRWVAFHAAVLASELATADFASDLRGRLAEVDEPAEHLYLRRALARAGEGDMPEAPLAPARSIAGERNLAWNTSIGSQSESSPFDAYYSMKVKADDHMRRAYASGRIIFGRASPIGSPGLIMVNSDSRDSFWLNLEQQLDLDDLAVLDGLIYGEETMTVTPDRLWDDGWRAFCLEAGISPERVDGVIENLTRTQRHAWTTWAGSRHIEGFNRLYEFTKRKYGILRPGIQVGTFLPEEGLFSRQSPDALLSWKFDLGGVYDYKGDNRLAGYSMIRRYKTLWPERPVLWLSLGIGGYEMNPVRYTQNVPDEPMFDRSNRAYNDTLTAWIAGADTGWFSTWIFVRPDFGRTGNESLSGVQVGLESLGPDTSDLERGIAHSFQGVEDIAFTESLPDAPSIPEASMGQLEEPVDDLLMELEARDEESAQREAIADRIRERRERFKEGFLFYQRYVYDSARIFGSLPRLHPEPRALVVRHGVTVWTRPSRPYSMIPAEALLQEFDFLCDVNMLPNIDLDRYELLVVHQPEVLRDATIERITRWLRETPGLLVVHLDLTSDNEAKDGTVDDHAGPLLNNWPWEGEIDRLLDADGEPLPSASPLTEVRLQTPSGPVAAGELTLQTRWDIMGDRAQPLITRDEEVVLAVWRDPSQFKGAVLFDGARYASIEYLNALREVINGLAGEGVGLGLEGPAVVEVLKGDFFQAAGSSRYYRTLRDEMILEGIEVMTGEVNPDIGGPGNRGAALVLTNYVGRYVAASENLVAISDQPFQQAEIEGDDLVLWSPGIIRVGTSGSGVVVERPNGGALVEPEDPVRWLLFSDQEGVTRFPRDADRPQMTYVRSLEPIRLRALGTE